MAFLDFEKGAINSILGDVSGIFIGAYIDSVPFNEVEIPYRDELIFAISAGIALALPIPFELKVYVQIGFFIVVSNYFESNLTFFDAATNIVFDTIAIIILVDIFVDKNSSSKEFLTALVIGVYYYVKNRNE